MRSMTRGAMRGGTLRKIGMRGGMPKGGGATAPQSGVMPLIKRDMKRRNATDSWDGFKTGSLGGAGEE